MEPIQRNDVFCEVCNINIGKKNFELHSKGKKHIAKKAQYNKIHKSVYVNGVIKFTPQELKKIFTRYGEVVHVQKEKDKPFAFVEFTDKSAVEKVLKTRIFASGVKLFVRKYKDYSNKNKADDENPKNLSETSTTAEGSSSQNINFGLESLPLKFQEASECPPDQNVFEWQVQQFINQVELSSEMYEQLNVVIQDVEELFQNTFPGCYVLVFGSCGATLAFRDSDVDLFLQCDSEQPQNFVRNEAKSLYKSPKIKIMMRIPEARVPIIRFLHLPTGWQCDLTAHSRLGVCNTRLIRFLISMDPRIRPLMLILKYWAKRCEVTSSRSLTTYSLIMLIIFYLQKVTPPILPPIALLQRLADHKEFTFGWESSFCDTERTVRSEFAVEENKSSLQEMLSGFFKFYKSVNFEKVVICPLLATLVPVEDFEEVSNLPEEMYLYKVSYDPAKPKQHFRLDVPLKVQDPFELGLNITKNVFKKSFSIFKKALEVSCEVTEKGDEAMLLKSLFSINKDSLDDDDDLSLQFYFKLQRDSPIPDKELMNLYNLYTNAIKLVLRHVLKFDIKPIITEMQTSCKVKKVDCTDDVHTLPNDSGVNDNSTFICVGNSDVWNSRKKTSKSLQLVHSSLSKFEKEVLISNALYHPNTANVSFKLSISPFEELKSGKSKSIIVLMSEKKTKKTGDLSQAFYFLRPFFKTLVLYTVHYVSKTQLTPAAVEVKESLQELFEFKHQTLSDVILSDKQKSLDNKCLTIVPDKQETILENQNKLFKALEASNSTISTHEQKLCSSSNSNDIEENLKRKTENKP